MRIKTGLKAKVPAGVSAVGWGAKTDVLTWLSCLHNSHSYCLSCKPPWRAARRWSRGPQWHQPPHFPPQRQETICTTTTVRGPTPTHAFSIPLLALFILLRLYSLVCLSPLQFMPPTLVTLFNCIYRFSLPYIELLLPPVMFSFSKCGVISDSSLSRFFSVKRGLKYRINISSWALEKL